MNTELLQFVKQAIEKGLSRHEIDAALKKAGWTPDERREALASYAEVEFPVAVPKRKPYMSAREAFMYLVLFMTLYISAFNFGALIFQFINRAYPDATRSYEYLSTTSAIRFAVASLVIAFPIFLWMSWLLKRAMQRQAERRASKIRKWLTYITLFISAGIIIGDLIAILFSFLDGELTMRFGLKALTILVIAGSVFGYYLWDLRQEEKD